MKNMKRKLPNSLKKYIRKEKARIKREFFDEKEQKEKIQELMEKLEKIYKISGLSKNKKV
jgi:hypothetical protein